MVLSSPGAGDDYDGRDHHLECERCTNAVRASSRQQWLVCPGPVGFLQADMLAGVERWKVTGAPVMVLLLRPLAGLQVLVDSCILGCAGGEEREVGSELPGV